MLTWIENVISRFNQPFPEKKGFERTVVTAFWVGLFITCFLYFFRPFGFYEPRFGAELFTLIFGLITFSTIVLFEIFTVYILKLNKDTDDWTLGKWILETLCLIFFISIGNYFFVMYLISESFSLQGFLGMILSTFVLGIFPMVFSGLLIQINAIKKNQKQASSVVLDHHQEKSSSTIISLSGQNDEQNLTFSTHELLYIEARSNYVSVCLDKEGKIVRESLRNTMKNIQNQLSEDYAIRSHRSFLINPLKVISVEGNAQGLRLSLDGFPEVKIPVSRSYMSEVKTKLSTHTKFLSSKPNRSI